MKTRSLAQICIVLALLVAILACSFTPQESEDLDATVEALDTSIAGTNTAIAGKAKSTSTPEQLQPTDTQAPPSFSPTQALQETSVAVDLSATQAALTPILEELITYEVDPQQGQLAWIHPPLRLEVDQFHGSKFDNQFPMVIGKDFVLSSDVTWDTEYGGSGCGFVFRADGNQQAPSQYMVVASRLATGHVFFAVMSQGQMVVGKDFYANGIDPYFDADNGATNHLAVVGRGTIFTIYSNGVKLGDANPNAPMPPLLLPDPPIKPFNSNDPVANAAYQKALKEYKQSVNKLKAEYNQRAALWSKLNKNFEIGGFAMGVVAQSGRTMCEFKDAWLWLMGAPPGQ